MTAPLTPATWARDSALAQGLPERVEDPEALRRVAVMLERKGAA